MPTPVATPPELANAGVMLAEMERGGYGLFDAITGHNLTGPFGWPLDLLDPAAPERGAVMGLDMEWFTHGRPAMFAAVEAGTIPLEDVRPRCGADWLRIIDVCDPQAMSERFVTRAVHLSEGPMMGEVLYALYQAGADPDLVNALVGVTWTCMEYPIPNLDPELWVELFTSAGFRENDVPAPKPAEPIRLYRGAVPEKRAGWAWTDDYAVAHKFAHEGFGWRRKDGVVWTALVPPEYLYAHLTGRGESEWVAAVPDHLIDVDGRDCSHLHLEG